MDSIAPRDEVCPFIVADLADFGETLDALSSVETGVYGKAALQAFDTDPVTFKNNTLSTYNVFEAARRLGIKNIVWASSETVLGLPFETPPPYVPVDEECSGPESAYSLSKLLSEEMARQFCRWDPDMKIIGFRFSNVMEAHDYAAFPDFEKDPRFRKWNLWSYIDARDAAQAKNTALETARSKDMEYVSLGKTGLKVARLCLGCMTYGTPEKGSRPGGAGLVAAEAGGDGAHRGGRETLPPGGRGGRPVVQIVRRGGHGVGGALRSPSLGRV